MLSGLRIGLIALGGGLSAAVLVSPSSASTQAGQSPSYAICRGSVPVAGELVPFQTLVNPAILQKLDCSEQLQAASATNSAVSGDVGTTRTWESETRPGVRGATTIMNERWSASGVRCFIAIDTIELRGEEVQVGKELCRPAGGGPYTLAASTASEPAVFPTSVTPSQARDPSSDARGGAWRALRRELEQSRDFGQSPVDDAGRFTAYRLDGAPCTSQLTQRRAGGLQGEVEEGQPIDWRSLRDVETEFSDWSHAHRVILSGPEGSTTLQLDGERRALEVQRLARALIQACR